MGLQLFSSCDWKRSNLYSQRSVVRNTACFTAGFDEVRLSLETRSMCMCVLVCLCVLFFCVSLCVLVRARKCVYVSSLKITDGSVLL